MHLVISNVQLVDLGSMHYVNDFVHIIYPSTTYICDINRWMWIWRRVHRPYSQKFVYDILNYLKVISIWFQCGIMNVCTNELQPTELGDALRSSMNEWVGSIKSAWSPSSQPKVSVCEGHSHPRGQCSANSRAWGVLGFVLQSLCPCPRPWVSLASVGGCDWPVSSPLQDDQNKWMS